MGMDYTRRTNTPTQALGTTTDETKTTETSKKKGSAFGRNIKSVFAKKGLLATTGKLARSTPVKHYFKGAMSFLGGVGVAIAAVAVSPLILATVLTEGSGRLVLRAARSAVMGNMIETGRSGLRVLKNVFNSDAQFCEAGKNTMVELCISDENKTKMGDLIGQYNAKHKERQEKRNTVANTHRQGTQKKAEREAYDKLCEERDQLCTELAAIGTAIQQLTKAQYKLHDAELKKINKQRKQKIKSVANTPVKVGTRMSNIPWSTAKQHSKAHALVDTNNQAVAAEKAAQNRYV